MNPWFLHVCNTSLLKTLWEKEKLLDMRKTLWEKEKMLVTKMFSKGRIVWERVNSSLRLLIKLLSLFTTQFQLLTILQKALLEKEKMLVTSIFSFSHNAYYTSIENFQFLGHIYFLVCKSFQFG